MPQVKGSMFIMFAKAGHSWEGTPAVVFRLNW